MYYRRYWREKMKLPECLIEEAEPEPTSYSAARALKHSGVWTEEMGLEFNGFDAAGTFVEMDKLHKGR